MTSHDQKQLEYFVDNKVIEVFLQIFDSMQSEVKMIQLALESIEKLLIWNTESSNEQYASVVNKMPSKNINFHYTLIQRMFKNWFILLFFFLVLDRLEPLQSHSNNKIYTKAMELMETYFNEDVEENDNADVVIGNH